MRFVLKRVWAWGAIIVSMIVLSSCREDTLIGNNLVPGSSYLPGIFTDTLTLHTSTQREDSLPASNLSKYVLGAMNDDVFGRSYAGVYTQLRLPSFGLSFGDSATVDSAVLSLTYAGFYGDKTSPQSIQVFRVTEALSDSTVYSDRTFTVDPAPIGAKINFVVNLDSSYQEGDTVYKPQLRIPISNALAQEILQQSPTGAFVDNASFRAFLKGLYVAPDTSAGYTKGVMYVNLRNPESALTIYYRFPSGAQQKLRLLMDGSSVNSNYFKHNYSFTPVQTAITNSGNEEASFVQSMAGVKTRLLLPHIHNLGFVIINKAELIITELATFADADSAVYAAPARILVIGADSNGKNTSIVDQTFGATGLPVYGGDHFTIVENGQAYTRYKLSIAGYLQQLINNQTGNFGLFLVNASGNSTADRIIIGGGNRNDAYRIKLNLIYTKIPQ